MFIGHFAVGLGAKRVAPTVSLGVLLMACQFADLLWPNFLLLGVERVEIAPGNTAFTPLNFVSYPYSHSLVALIVWGAVLGALYWRATGSTPAAAVTVGIVVVSHWLLDVVTHRPDMPWTIVGDMRIGLSLWNSIPATILVEAVMFGVGLAMYLGTTKARDRAGSAGLWGLIAVLLAVYVGNILGPPPPSTAALAWTAEGLWIFVLWAFWVDRHRQPARPKRP